MKYRGVGEGNKEPHDFLQFLLFLSFVVKTSAAFRGFHPRALANVCAGVLLPVLSR